VQAVGVLVRLRTHGIRQRADHAELVDEVVEVRTVPQGEHLTQVPTVPAHRCRRDDECAFAGDDEHATHGAPVGDQTPQTRREVGLRGGDPGHAPATEEARRRVVADGDAAGRVNGEHPFADAVQHRLVLAQQIGQVGRLKPEGLAAHPAGEQRRRHDAQDQRPAGEAAGGTDQDAGAARDLVRRDTYAHLSDDPAVGGAHRRLAAGPPPEGPGLERHHLATAQRLGWRADRLADPGRVGMGVADAAVVGHDDEEHLRACAYRFRPPLHLLRRVVRLESRDDDRVGGDRPRHGQRPLLVLVLQLAPQLHRDQAEAGSHGEQQHGDLHEQGLRREAGVPHPVAPPHTTTIRPILPRAECAEGVVRELLGQPAQEW
jgi:hypothetical protein